MFFLTIPANAQTVQVNHTAEKPNEISLNIEGLQVGEKYNLILVYKIGEQYFTGKIEIFSNDSRISSGAMSFNRYETLQLFWGAKPIKFEDIPIAIRTVISEENADEQPSKNKNIFFGLWAKDEEFVSINAAYGNVTSDWIGIVGDDLAASLYKSPYETSNAKLPFIIVLGGSEGGFANPHFSVNLSYEHYIVISVAYFGIKGTPDCLMNINIDALKPLVNYLKSHPLNDGTPISLIGVSRGADYVTHYAKENPDDIGSLILVAPDTYMYGRARCTKTLLSNSSFLIDGEVIPYIPYVSLNWWQRAMVRIQNNKTGASDLRYRKKLWLNNLSNKTKLMARLPLRDIDIPVLILKGGDDRLSEFDEKTIELKRSQNVLIKRYENAGHKIFGSIFSPMYQSKQLTDKKGNIRLRGGTDEANAEARYQVWISILDFLEDQYGPYDETLARRHKTSCPITRIKP